MEGCECGVGESWCLSMGLGGREGSMMNFWSQDLTIVITFDHFFLTPRFLLLFDVTYLPQTHGFELLVSSW